MAKFENLEERIAELNDESFSGAGFLMSAPGQALQFKVNNLKTQQDLLSRTFSDRKMQELDKSMMAIKELQADVEVLNTKSGSYAKMFDLAKIDARFKEYARIDVVKEI